MKGTYKPVGTDTGDINSTFLQSREFAVEVIIMLIKNVMKG